jgi:hypothetical protein
MTTTSRQQTPPPQLTAGADLYIGASASCQFAGRPIRFRLTRVEDRMCDIGYVWLTGYELNAGGDAVDKREVYVIRAGLRAWAGQPVA